MSVRVASNRFVPLAPLTTFNIGGPVNQLIAVSGTQELLETCNSVWDSGEPWRILGGGSNVLVSDDGFPGTVIQVLSRGIQQRDSVSGDPPGTVRLRVQAGEPWDFFVSYTVEHGLSGLEALSGIPGLTGATPIQNIGAYGQEVSSVVSAVHFFDYKSRDLQTLDPDELGFSYRHSVFKEDRSGVIVAVDFLLNKAGDDHTALGEPVVFSQLASALGVSVGERIQLSQVRNAVLTLREAKGMLVNPEDPDSVSAGSFFTNPIVSENFARSLPSDAPRWLTTPERQPNILPLLPEGNSIEVVPSLVQSDVDYRVKLSAAWLIEHAGIHRGFSLPGSRAAVSKKHTLALINTGGATAAEVLELARFIHLRVLDEYGVSLVPEPVFWGDPE